MCLCVNTNVTSSHSEGGTTGGWEGEDARERENERERERERGWEGLTCGNKLTCMLQKFC